MISNQYLLTEQDVQDHLFFRVNRCSDEREKELLSVSFIKILQLSNIIIVRIN